MTAYVVTILTLVAIAGVAGLALNLQWGLGGMVNFGLVGFYALGSYMAALVALAGVPPVVALLLAGAFTGLVSGAVALLTIRITEDFLAIATLAFAETIGIVLLNESWLTRGSLGLPGVPRPFFDLVGAENYPVFFLAFTWAVLAIVFVILERLTRSPFGRALRAVREDDVVAATLGKNVLWIRVRAFAVGGVVVGIAGSLHAFYYTFIDPTQFTTIITAYAFMAVVAGGQGSNRGLILGATFVLVLLEGTRFLDFIIPIVDASQMAALRLILIGLALILLLIYRPQGLLPEYRFMLGADNTKRKGKTQHDVR